MYAEFYDLKEMPFNLTPSPRFLYLGEKHKEALALLTYGVIERKGFILLTGAIGTGKTTMVQALLSNLDESVHCIHLSNPLLSPREFVDYLAFSAFQKKVHFKSKADFLVEFEEYLLRYLQLRNNVILIIDEAQDLSFELLEEIRLLSNMESAEEKLINIFLVGQPELNEKLRDQRCLPLLQRIAHRYHIPPLDLEDTRGYMATRLKIAGAKNPNDIFPQSTVKAIYHYSQGYPRVINILADNALLLGYSEGKKKITLPIIDQCFKDMSLESPVVESRPEPPEPYEIAKSDHPHERRYWRWVLPLCLVIALLSFGLSWKGWAILGPLLEPKPAGHEIPSNNTASPGHLTVKIEEIREREASVAKSHVREQHSADGAQRKIGAQTTQIGKLEKARDRALPLHQQDNGLSSTLIVEEAVICRDVSNNRPIASGESFKASVGKVFCFTKIIGARSPTVITHVWYFGDTERGANIKLPVKSSAWRTYSSKKIKAHEVGDWHVKVLDPQGKVLRILQFRITP